MSATSSRAGSVPAARMILGLRLSGLGEGAELAERGGVDFVLLDDSAPSAQGSIDRDPLSIAAFLTTRTKRLGLAASVPDSWAPFNVARALASFDHLSGGRCAWLPWPGRGEAVHPKRSAEHLDVVLQLFDSWDDDALVFDKAAAVFADRDKVRRIRHSGAFFAVDGPLNAPRPPQGRPVLIQRLADASSAADVVLVALSGRPEAEPPPSRAALRLAEIDLDLQVDVERRCAALAERMAEAYPGRCDGFLMTPTQASTDISRLVDLVLPRLSELGLVRPPPAGETLRARLGLPRPLNRFSPPGSAET